MSEKLVLLQNAGGRYVRLPESEAKRVLESTKVPVTRMESQFKVISEKTENYDDLCAIAEGRHPEHIGQAGQNPIPAPK